MSDPVIVAIIAAVPSTLSLLLTMAIVLHAWHVPGKLEALVENTNGLTEKLLGQTALASRAEGVHEGAEAEKVRIETAADANASIILAAAQLAADKILAAAKLAKEGGGKINDLGR